MKTGRIVGVVAAATVAAAAFTGAAMAFAANDTHNSGQQAQSQQSPGQQSRGQESPGQQSRDQQSRDHGRGDHGPGDGGPGGMGPGGMGPGHDGERGDMVHGEAVIETPEGTFVTQRMQEGEVTAVSATSISVKSDDGFTATYAVATTTKVVRDGVEGTSPKVGDEVHVRATVTGGTATADDVMALSPEKAAERDQQRAAMEEWMSQRPEAPQPPPGQGSEQGQPQAQRS